MVPIYIIKLFVHLILLVQDITDIGLKQYRKIKLFNLFWIHIRSLGFSISLLHWDPLDPGIYMLKMLWLFNFFLWGEGRVSIEIPFDQGLTVLSFNPIKKKNVGSFQVPFWGVHTPSPNLWGVYTNQFCFCIRVSLAQELTNLSMWPFCGYPKGLILKKSVKFGYVNILFQLVGNAHGIIFHWGNVQ